MNFSSGKAHTPSQRLLDNLLNTEKTHVDAVLQSLALSHNQQAALNAYASAGRDEALGLAVGGVVGVLGEEFEPSQEAYASTLSNTRLALKEIRDAEERLANVTRDRDILVQRMIKATKKKPSKSELRNQAANGSGSSHNHKFGRHDHSSDNASSPSTSSFDKTGKLEEAQLELAGCEDTLRKEEAHVEGVRRQVLREILEDRLRGMAAVGHATERAAQRALVELHTYLADGAPFDQDLSNVPRNQKTYTPSVDSNTPSLAPSQSASQIEAGEYSSDEESVSNRRHSRAVSGVGSQRGRGLQSVIETDSSDEERAVQVVENNSRASRQAASDVGSSRQRTKSASAAPPPAPSSSWNKRRSTVSNAQPTNGNDSSSDDGENTLRNGMSGRKSQSDLGHNGKPKGGAFGRRQSLARRGSSSSFGGSETGSVRKKKGFFASFKSLFSNPSNGSSRGSRAGSPDSMASSSNNRRSTNGWSTRTETNAKKMKGTGGFGRGGGGSSDEDESGGRGGLVAVSNVNRIGSQKGKKAATPVEGENQWKIEQAVMGGGRPPVKRSSSSKSTIKGIAMQSKPAAIPPVAPGSQTYNPPSSSASGVSRSNTSKSTKSTKAPSKSTSSPALAGGATTVSKPPAAVSDIKKSASTKTSATKKTPAAAAPAKPEGPVLFEIKAPRSNNPGAGLTLPRAPGSSIVLPSMLSPPPMPSSIPASAPSSPATSRKPNAASSTPSSTVKRSNSFTPSSSKSSNVGSDTQHTPHHRVASPLPRSALKKGSGSANSSLVGAPTSPNFGLAPPLPTLIGITAPPPVSYSAPKDTTDTESVYETGVEDNDELDDGNDTDRGTPPAAVPSPSNTGSSTDPTLSRRKSVRLDVPPTPNLDPKTSFLPASNSVPTLAAPIPRKLNNSASAATLTPSSSNSTNASSSHSRQSSAAAPGTGYEPGGWSTRIGRDDDSSDEDEDEGEYATARRAMASATRHFDKAGKPKVKKSTKA